MELLFLPQIQGMGFMVAEYDDCACPPHHDCEICSRSAEVIFCNLNPIDIKTISKDNNSYTENNR